MRADLPSGTVTFLFTDIERMLLLLDNFEQAMEELVEPALTDAWEQGRNMTPDEAVALILDYWARGNNR